VPAGAVFHPGRQGNEDAASCRPDGQRQDELIGFAEEMQAGLKAECSVMLNLYPSNSWCTF
jgi:hypothetical protein